MSSIVSIHSYRGGTGKSNITANLACLAARRGHRVAVLDTDLASPGVHVIFGLEKGRIVHTVNDFLFGRCDLEDAAYDVSSAAGLGPGRGAVYLLPSRMQIEAIMKVIGEGYNAAALNAQLENIGRVLDLDLLLIDTHPGLNRETLLTTAISTALLILVRPDDQDYHGTAVIAEVAKRLGVPQVFLLANKVLGRPDPAEVQATFREAFGHEVVGVLWLDEQMAALGSRGLFIADYPDHALTAELNRVAERLLAATVGRAV